jgi:uncharacterized protein YdeI (YjbR/CyaY-like superfamily)
MPKKKAPKKSKPIKQVSKKFRATLERAGNLGWTVIYLPFNVEETWGTRAQIRVRGEVNGVPFRTAAFPTKRGVHFVMINRKMQSGGGVTAGSTASFRIEPDMEERVIHEPKELLRIFREYKKVEKWYREKLNHSARKEISKWVGEPKQAETRVRRAEQIAERLMATMEAERELPPIIQRAMDEHPKANQGWKLMTPAARRGELLAIFYYRNPESQHRRIEKAIERMLERAEKKSSDE